MANSYIVLDGKRYAVALAGYQPQIEKSQSIDVTVGGETLSQTFVFVDGRWQFNLRADYIPADDYGSLADLKASYLKPYVTFVDHYGVDQGTVFFVGACGEVPDSPALDGVAAKFTVPVLLRKRQVSG